MKTLTIFIIALTALNFGAVAAFADDMWSETPDLENLKAPSFTSEPSRLSNKPPTVDMWAETPTLENNDDTVNFHYEKVVVKSGLAHPELYAETPDLKKMSPTENDRRSPDEVTVAEQKKKGDRPTEDKRIR
jgi:hypothetical protein